MFLFIFLREAIRRRIIKGAKKLFNQKKKGEKEGVERSGILVGGVHFFGPPPRLVKPGIALGGHAS